ncbi:MAG: hypothetical protein VXY56_04585, partial [Pseudomonadota bacterium]|nr:hypothetical protein [Pseudomonadota bacterium]
MSSVPGSKDMAQIAVILPIEYSKHNTIPIIDRYTRFNVYYNISSGGCKNKTKIILQSRK